MEVEGRFYIVKDTHGNWDYDCTEDSSNTIQICGMKDKDGNALYFENDAYYLETWCYDNKLEFKLQVKSFNIEF